jgi:Spy/CpxP family protein refolding chaperone
VTRWTWSVVGPLKHVRAAALAAALVPLASVMATPASAQVSPCASGGFCGLVWEDGGMLCAPHHD